MAIGLAPAEIVADLFEAGIAHGAAVEGGEGAGGDELEGRYGFNVGSAGVGGSGS